MEETTKDTEKQETVECVGSLLIHSTDVQELTDKAVPVEIPDGMTPSGEMVGSLLVQPSDVQELSEKAAKLPEGTSNLVKRVTERVAEDVHSPTQDDFNPWSNSK